MNADVAQMNVPQALQGIRALVRRSTKRTHPRFTFICATSAFICVFTAFCITPSIAAEISLRDDLDRAIVLKQPAQRIVTLAPFLTELVYTAGAGERIVGVSAYSDYPPEAKKLPQVGTAVSLSIERIAALAPDLVLVWQDSARPEDVERITRLGAAVYVAHSRNFEDVPRNLAAIGELTGRDVRPAIADFEQRLAQLREDNAGKRKVTAFLEIWNRPLTTIAGRHFINEALEICGARNVFRELDGVAPVVSWEQVYLRDPQIVVGMSSAASAAQFRANWKARRTLSAVKGDRLVFVDADRIQRLTARTPDGIAALCAGIDRYR
jgi:iron complex transport system substrate-binding protein